MNIIFNVQYSIVRSHRCLGYDVLLQINSVLIMVFIIHYFILKFKRFYILFLFLFILIKGSFL